MCYGLFLQGNFAIKQVPANRWEQQNQGKRGKQLYYNQNTEYIVNMRLTFLFVFLIGFCPNTSFTQNQANIWYFPVFGGLDYNSGKPKVIPSNVMGIGSAVMSDTLGNLLFYSGGRYINNKNLVPMKNGDSLIGDDPLSTQRVLIVQQPESDHLYYVFFVGRGPFTNTSLFGLWYNVVDMDGDNGLGEVIVKNVFIDAAWDAEEKLFAVKHANGKDVWIITRKTKDNKFAAFLLSKNGLNTTPVLSDGTFLSNVQDTRGYLKISYDKKYIFAAYQALAPHFVEIGKFNNTTGEINILYYLTKVNAQGLNVHPFGIEFSPDSKLVYIAFQPVDYKVEIYQYDM